MEGEFKREIWKGILKGEFERGITNKGVLRTGTAYWVLVLVLRTGTAYSYCVLVLVLRTRNGNQPRERRRKKQVARMPELFQ